jgi:DNA-binding response OmpR family regulator
MERSAILVADPDPRQRQLIDMMLSIDGADLTLVESAREALAHLREHTPTTMIFSTELPDIDGFALCLKVKAVARLARVPVVLVATPADAGGLDDDTRSRARTAGADLLLQRPLGDKNLRERISRLAVSPPTDPGYAPLQAPEARAYGSQATIGSMVGTTPASELGGLRAEVAQLRAENAALKVKLAKYKTQTESLQGQLEELRKKPRGLFGRRG